MKPSRVIDPTRPDPTMRGRCALAVMTKAPQPGKVKTRLVPPLTTGEAAELNKCFLTDTAASISSICSHRSMNDAAKTELRGQLRVSHSEAATDAVGIAVYTPIGAESAYNEI